MAKILEAYFGMKVWESTHVQKRCDKRKYVVYKVNDHYKKLTNIFLQYMKPCGEPEPIESETNYGCLIPEDW
jgi:hypothetical protein